MDPLEEFLSPEALRLLLDSDDFATTVNEPSVTTFDQSLTIITPLAVAVNNPIPHESKPTRKRPASDDNIPGCSTLVLDKGGSSKPKRAKFSAEARAKVASVRKKGACMKCHRNKIPCSGEWPCESCCRSRAVIAGRASRHRWMDCVPFSMKDLDIFASEIVPNDHLVDESIKTLLGSSNYYSCQMWHYEQVSVVKRQRDADAYCLRSRLPARHLWKFSLKDSPSVHIDKRLDESFRLLVIIHLNLCIEEIKIESIVNAYFVAGSRLLQDLERALSNSFLSGCDADTLRELFTIIFFTASVIIFPRPPSLRKSYDRQQQLLCVLAHHIAYIGERVGAWDDLSKEEIIGTFASKGNIRILPYSFLTVPSAFFGDLTKYCDHSVGEMVGGVPTALDPRRGDTGHENDRAIAQRYSTAVSPSQPNTQPEDRYRTANSGNEIGPANSVTTAASLPELQTDTVCGWCGSVQTSYKPVQGVVLCDICLPQYQQNDLTASGWDLAQPRSTEQSIIPASGLDYSQGDSTNYASWPDVTASSGYGGDIDDFSWFMAS